MGSSAASGQENPVVDPQSVQPVIPYSVGEQLAARRGDVDDLKQRHPWIPNNAPFPLNFGYLQGSWVNANGSSTVVVCWLDTAAEHPLWYQENMLRTWAVGGVRCNVRLAEEAGGGMTGTARAISYPGGSQLASASLNSQHQVPEDRGFGWQAWGLAEFDRASVNSNQQVKLEARLTLPAWAGTSNVGWNSYHGCTKESNRVINCELWSPPFQTLPYPCPGSPLQGAKLGAQPPGCTQGPAACDIANGQYGIQPNCTTIPAGGAQDVDLGCQALGGPAINTPATPVSADGLAAEAAADQSNLEAGADEPDQIDDASASAGDTSGQDPRPARTNAYDACGVPEQDQMQVSLRGSSGGITATAAGAVTCYSKFGGPPQDDFVDIWVSSETWCSGDIRGVDYQYILCIEVRKNPPDEDPYWDQLKCKNRSAGAHYEHRNRRVEARCKNGTHKYRGWAWLMIHRGFSFVTKTHKTAAVFRSC
jgi:hypothetical protein